MRNGLTSPAHGVGSSTGAPVGDSSGCQCPGSGVRHPRGRPEPPVALSRVEHRLGRCVTHCDALHLEGVVVDRTERGCIRGGERASAVRPGRERRPLRCSRDQLREHVVRRRRDRGVDRRPRTGAPLSRYGRCCLGPIALTASYTAPCTMPMLIGTPVGHRRSAPETRQRRRRDLVPVRHLTGVGPYRRCGRCAEHAEHA